jgi:hypothetical protein
MEKNMKKSVISLLFFVSLPVFSNNASSAVAKDKDGALYNAPTASLVAATPVYYLTTWLHNGRRDAYPLSEHPVITYRNNLLQISTQSQTIEYAAVDVRKFTLSDRDESSEAPLLLGDVNADGKVNVVDVSSIVGITLNNDFSDVADVNADGSVNVVDVSSVVGMILNQTANSDMGVLMVRTNKQRSSLVAMGNMRLKDGVVKFSSCQPSEEVKVFNEHGEPVASYRADAHGSLLVYINDYPAGTYIIKFGTTTHKVMLK